MPKSIALNWLGPFSWPGFEKASNLDSLPDLSGVYLQCFRYKQGYSIYLAGITKRPFSQRFREHTGKYLSGDYTILDPAAANKGKRLELWHGWGWTEPKRELFQAGKEIIQGAATEQMKAFRLFVAEVEEDNRLPERIEASVMAHLYNLSSPLSKLPDKGMFLSPRRKDELEIRVENLSDKKLYGMPKVITV